MCSAPQILTKTGELPRQPTTHPEETEEELTEQQEALLGESTLTMPREGSTESESTQEDLEEEEVEEEEEEDCIQVKDEEGESGPEEGPDLEESSAAYKKVPLPASSHLCLPGSQTLTTPVCTFQPPSLHPRFPLSVGCSCLTMQELPSEQRKEARREWKGGAACVGLRVCAPVCQPPPYLRRPPLQFMCVHV